MNKKNLTIAGSVAVLATLALAATTPFARLIGYVKIGQGESTSQTIEFDSGGGAGNAKITSDSSHNLYLSPLATNGPVFTSGANGRLNSEASLAIARGGTGAGTKSAAFDALSPMTTSGDIIVGGTSGTGTRSACATANTVLRGGTPAACGALVNADIPTTLTGKTLSGNTATNLVSGSGTLTLNTSGTATVPNATDTLVGKATTDILTNKTLSGNTATNLVSGSGSLTLNTSGAVTVPSATDTLVGKATTDVLTNKTINGASNTLTVRLGSDISGTLGVGNGGTNLTSVGTAGQSLMTNSAASAMAWQFRQVVVGTNYTSNTTMGTGGSVYTNFATSPAMGNFTATCTCKYRIHGSGVAFNNSAGDNEIKIVSNGAGTPSVQFNQGSAFDSTASGLRVPFSVFMIATLTAGTSYNFTLQASIATGTLTLNNSILSTVGGFALVAEQIE